MRAADLLRVPYLQRVGVGLHIGPRAVRWVELSRSFAGVPGLESSLGRLRLRRSEVEPVEGGQHEAALERLMARVQPASPFVHTHVDPEHVRVHFETAPAFEDDEDLAAWLAERPSRYVPAGSTASEFIARTAVVSRHPPGDSEGARCLISLARREAVEERAAMLERVGLVPLRIGTGIVEVGSAFAFDPDYEASEPVVVHVWDDAAGDEAATALQTRRAMPYDLAVLPGVLSAGLPLDGLVSEIEAHFGGALRLASPDREGERGTVWITGAVERSGLASGGYAGAQRPRIMRPLATVLKGRVVPADSVLAASLATEALYPELALMDVQRTAQTEEAETEHEKQEAYRAVLGLGVLVLALLILSGAAGWMLQTKVDEVRVSVASQSGELAELATARRMQERLRADLAVGRALVHERTVAAVVLEAVGQAVPDEMELSSIQFETSPGGDVVVALSGWTATPAGVRDLIERLEADERFSGVRLLSTERLDGSQAERETGRSISVTVFSLSVVYRRS